MNFTAVAQENTKSIALPEPCPQLVCPVSAEDLSTSPKYSDLAAEITRSPVFDPYRNRDGRLSKEKYGVVMTTVAVLFGHVFDTWRKDEERRSKEYLFERLGRLWQFPLVHTQGLGADAEHAPATPVKARIFNWGNFVTMAGAIAMGIAIWQTQSLTSWRSVAEGRANEIVGLTQERDKLRVESVALQKTNTELESALKFQRSDASYWREKYDDAAKSQAVAKDAGALQTQVNALQAEIAEARATAASAQTSASAEAKSAETWKTLYDTAQKDLEHARSVNDDKADQIAKLQDDLARARNSGRSR